MGRSISWTDEKKEIAVFEILECVSSGRSLRSIIDNADRDIIPSFFIFSKWLKEDEEFEKRYAHACEARSELIFEQILEIADDTVNDYTETEEGRKINQENIQRSRLKVDARKWMLSKMNPKRFGDKIENTLKGDANSPINIISLGSGINPND